MPEQNNKDIEISSDVSDRQNFNEENVDEENSNEENYDDEN